MEDYEKKYNEERENTLIWQNRYRKANDEVEYLKKELQVYIDLKEERESVKKWQQKYNDLDSKLTMTEKSREFYKNKLLDVLLEERDLRDLLAEYTEEEF